MNKVILCVLILAVISCQPNIKTNTEAAKEKTFTKDDIKFELGNYVDSVTLINSYRFSANVSYFIRDSTYRILNIINPMKEDFYINTWQNIVVSPNTIRNKTGTRIGCDFPPFELALVRHNTTRTFLISYGESFRKDTSEMGFTLFHDTINTKSENRFYVTRKLIL